MIKYKDIKLNYEGRQLFDNFSLEIEKGKNVCLSGSSGKGKTTLLKMLPGLVIPDSGSVFLDELELSPQNTCELRKRITWIPQNINLPVNTALELMHLLFLTDNKPQIAKNFVKLGLDETYFDKRFADISGGEKQRIVISVALAKNKPVILMDEPTSALDSGTIELLANLIGELKDATILSASHNKQWLEKTDMVIKI